MNTKLLVILALVLLSHGQVDWSQIRNYSQRPNLAVLIDSIQLRLSILGTLRDDSNASIYQDGQLNASTTEMTETLVTLILLQRDLENNGFFTGSQTRSVLGVTTSLIAGDACNYLRELVSSGYNNFNCSTAQLQDISWQFQLHTITDKVNQITWKRARLARYRIIPQYQCTYWNTRLANNCTGLSGRYSQNAEAYNLQTLQLMRNISRTEYNEDCRIC